MLDDPLNRSAPSVLEEADDSSRYMDSIAMGMRRVRSSMAVVTLDESLRGSVNSRSRRAARDRSASVASDGTGPIVPPVKSTVMFKRIEIREYPICLGDNPSVSSGPPVTIDWEHMETRSFDFEDYESSKLERRQLHEMVLPRKVREQMLKNSGHSKRELANAVRANLRAKQRRIATVRNLQFFKTQETLERVKRKLQFKNKKNKLDYTWENWEQSYRKELAEWEETESKNSTVEDLCSDDNINQNSTVDGLCSDGDNNGGGDVEVVDVQRKLKAIVIEEDED